MRLSDMISGIGHTVFVEIGLVLFLMIFAGVIFYVVTMKREQIQYMESLPLEDGPLTEDKG